MRSMNNFTRNIIALLLLFSLTKMASAQEGAYYDPNTDYEGWSIALGTGFSQFYGDVSEYGFFEKLNNESKLSWSIMAGKEMNSWFTLRAQMMGGRLKSYRDLFDDGRPANLFLDTKYFEAGVNGKFGLDQLWMEKTPERRWEIYGVAGMSFATWDALLRDAVTRDEIDPNAETVHYGVTFPLGLGFEYRVYENWHLYTEWTYRLVASEMVDLVEGGFVMDPFLNVAFGINYKFGNGFLNGGDEEPEEEENRSSRQRTQEDEYERLDFEGPDIQEISTNLTCTSDSSESNRQSDDSSTPSRQDTQEKEQDSRMHRSSSGSSPGYVDADEMFDSGLVFSVQLLAVSKPVDAQRWKQQYNIRRDISESHTNGLYRYFAGTFDNYQAAASYADIARTKGVSDAFVVALRDGKRVRLTSEMKNKN